MDITFYQVCIIEVTAFIIGILLILKGVKVFNKAEISNEIQLGQLGISLMFLGFCLSTPMLSRDGCTVRYIASVFNPCLNNSFSFECLDGELVQIIKKQIEKDKKHRSEGQ